MKIQQRSTISNDLNFLGLSFKIRICKEQIILYARNTIILTGEKIEGVLFDKK